MPLKLVNTTCMLKVVTVEAQKMTDRNWRSCGGHCSEDDRLGTGGALGAVFFITCQMVMMELGTAVVSAVCK